MFKDICAEFLDGSQMYPKQFFDFQTMLWKQQGIEYYLLYSLNAFLAEEQDEAVTSKQPNIGSACGHGALRPVASDLSRAEGEANN